MSGSHVRAANLVGALALAVADRVAVAGEQASGQSAAAPAALSALHEYAGGCPIDTLRAITGLSPSGAVRLVDRLEAAGLARREPGRDGRTLSVELTAAGAAAAARIREARKAALLDVLGALDDEEAERLGELSGLLLAGLTEQRTDAWRICRLCDPVACGHFDDRCPVTIAAREGEAARDAERAGGGLDASGAAARRGVGAAVGTGPA